GEEETNLTDRLAYWWDLAPWRGQEVELELTIRGTRERSEIAWRSLSIRSAIGNLEGDAKPFVPDVPLTSLKAARQTGHPPLASGSNSSQEGPIRLLGQEFESGVVLSKSSSAKFSLA